MTDTLTLAALQALEKEWRDDGRRRWITSLFGDGRTVTEMANLGQTNRVYLHREMARLGVSLESLREAQGITPRSRPAASTTTMLGMTDDQRRDYETLVSAGYSADEARQIATKPKVRVRAVTKRRTP